MGWKTWSSAVPRSVEPWLGTAGFEGRSRALLPLGVLASLNAVLEVARLLAPVAYFMPWCPGQLVSQLSLQLCCLRRQSRCLGQQLLQFLVVLGLSHQDLLRSHLHISILAHPALSLSPCLIGR